MLVAGCQTRTMVCQIGSVSDIRPGLGYRTSTVAPTINRQRQHHGNDRLIRHAGQLTLRLPPGQQLLAQVLARLRRLPIWT